MGIAIRPSPRPTRTACSTNGNRQLTRHQAPGADPYRTRWWNGGKCQVDTPTPAASTTTSVAGPSWRSGLSIRRVMPGQGGVPVAHILTRRDPTPQPRWCAFSVSIPREGKSDTGSFRLCCKNSICRRVRRAEVTALMNMNVTSARLGSIALQSSEGEAIKPCNVMSRLVLAVKLL